MSLEANPRGAPRTLNAGGQSVHKGFHATLGHILPFIAALRKLGGLG